LLCSNRSLLSIGCLRDCILAPPFCLFSWRSVHDETKVQPGRSLVIVAVFIAFLPVAVELAGRDNPNPKRKQSGH
jgi:hypothetical protein